MPRQCSSIIDSNRMLADKIGRRNSMLWFGALGTLFTVPILLSLKSVSSPFLAFVLITVALAIVSFYTSISGLVKAEMFPPQVRALGVGLACRNRRSTCITTFDLYPWA